MGTVVPISDPSIPAVSSVAALDYLLLDVFDNTQLTSYKTRKIKSSDLFNTAPIFNSAQTATGHFTNNPFHYLNSIVVNPYNANTDFNGAAFGVDVTVNGSSAQTGTGLCFFAIVGNIYVSTQAASAGSAWCGLYGGVVAETTMVSPAGGGIFGVNGNVIVLPNVGGFQVVNAGEFDLAVGTGATGVLVKTGVMVIIAPSDAVAGSTSDAGFQLKSSSSSTPGFLYGYQVDTQELGQKVINSSTGIAFGTRGAQTVGSAVDVSSATCVTAEWKSKHALINGSGQMIVGAGAFTAGGAAPFVVHIATDNNLVVTANGANINMAGLNDAFNTAINLQVSALNWVVDGSGNATFNGLLKGAGFATAAPSTKSVSFTADTTHFSYICNGAGSITVTLPSASTNVGLKFLIKTIAAQTVISANNNIVPLNGGAAGSAILAGTIGKWALIESDGANYQIMASN